jgi:hypothetical protein
MAYALGALGGRSLSAQFQWLIRVQQNRKIKRNGALRFALLEAVVSSRLTQLNRL